MFIGLLEPKNVTYTHKGTSLQLPPSKVEDGKPVWLWKDIYDCPIDMNYQLDGSCFVGAVCLAIPEHSVTAVEVLIDGNVSGSHSAETGGITGGVLNIPVGAKGSLVTVRLYTYLKDITLESIEILGAREDGEPLVYPTPKSIEYLGGFVKIKDIVSKNGDADELFAVEFLKERLSESFGDWQSSRGSVIVFDKRVSASYGGERYTVKSVRGKMKISAATRLALLYGADTLLQLTELKRGVRKFNCDDRPAKQFRGFHTGLPHPEKFDFMRRLFRYVLLPLRYNTLFVQVSGSMRLHSHPEIAEAWARAVERYRRGEMPAPPHVNMLANGEILEQEDVVRYVSFARELGFEIIPEIQSLGHVQYITLAHPELAEIEEKETVVEDTRNEDERPDAEYYHSYCPSNEDSYRLIFDVIDEVVEVIRPDRYVHIGHDEIYQIGLCKLCREKDPAQLLATHVTRLHDYLAKKGLRTAMWADMLQPPPAANYATYKAIDAVPKDILMLDFIWYFNIPRNIEDNLLEKGFTVGVGNLYSSHYPRYSERIKKKNVIGGEISTWLEVSEQVFGENGKLFDMMYLSEMLWNADNYDERNRRTYTKVIAEHIQPRLRDGIRGKINPAGYKAKNIRLPAGGAAPCQVRALCRNAIVMKDERVIVDGEYERLVIQHATLTGAPRIVWKPIPKIGDYIITYSDGSRIDVPVRYAANIMEYKSVYGKPMPQEYYRHNGYVGTWFSDPAYQGKTSCGEDITVYGFLWENPFPEKKISILEYKPVEGDYCGLILAGVVGLNRK